MSSEFFLLLHDKDQILSTCASFNTPLAAKQKAHIFDKRNIHR